jgi:hypothetical protein
MSLKLWIFRDLQINHAVPANFEVEPHVAESWITNESWVVIGVKSVANVQYTLCTCSQLLCAGERKKSDTTTCGIGFDMSMTLAIDQQCLHPSFLWCTPNGLEKCELTLERVHSVVARWWETWDGCKVLEQEWHVWKWIGRASCPSTWHMQFCWSYASSTPRSLLHSTCANVTTRIVIPHD